ncbi:WYL domain-containing protein [Acinetobacter bohemicus]|uniref:WYL domain-containing protein n=1 Tax=Acinetobacter lwoffii TaxID=28090 RepID=A0A9D2ZYW5_ACILW|nr:MULTISPECIES: WYL domain-containing protein [unclassified Acinetobacter]HJF27530.1 WYL domain-containing protein [Acinetobacter lwoffii]MCO8044158.1 WYL domain-containing protein [Acinetobacter sp. S4397-1]TQR64707.1 WYL domain-containing protein [Acinetobacter sp. RF14B]TSH70135.1 WYL domain-containing protein [Acinetobacter sp. RF15A]TSI14760.1 WYL domain-containing protein [Acinetobacter sp. RF15B]
MSAQEKETSNSLYRQWQILSRLSTGKWMGTRELQEILNREGIEISLRTIQRDLNQIAQRFPIESSKTTPQGWRWRSDAPIQSLPHMTSSQAVTFMMVEEHLKHLLPPSLIDEMNPWFDLARRSLSSQNNVRQWINRVRIVPATQPLIPPFVDKVAQQAIYEALLQDKQLECVYQGRGLQSEEKTYILNPLALVQKGSIIYLVCTRHDKSDIQTFALHRFKSAIVLNSRALHPVNFDIDDYIESGALGFRVDFNHPTENVTLKLTMDEVDAHYFEESQLSKDQKIEKLENGMFLISATVPFTSQLTWWLRSFGKKIKQIEPTTVANAVYQLDSQDSQ